VLLIVMDAVRPDHLSCYGYHRSTSPFLDDLAARGIICDQAFTTAPWTPPAHASLFTGTYPSKHGVDVGENLSLAEDNVTLAKILAARGYRTFAILPDGHLSGRRGFQQGFQESVELFRLPRLKWDWAHLKSVARNALLGRDKRSYLANCLIKRWLARQVESGAPFFVFVNYKTAHNRYQPPAPFRRRFEIPPRPDQDLEKLRYFSKNGGYPYMAGGVPMSEADFEVVKSWYDGAIACIDARVADLVRCLKRLRMYDDTLIVITADHGENFGDHGLAYHVFCLYDSLIRVPLIFHFPAGLRAPQRVGQLVSLTDVLPTILEVVGIGDADYGETQGTSLLPFDGRRYHDHIFAEFDRPTWMLKSLATRFPGRDFSPFNRGLQCVRTLDYKLIVGSDATEQLYHLTSDPGETVDIRPIRPDTADELRAVLTNWRATMKPRSSEPPDDPAPRDDEAIERNLRDLGYL
jgi:arylsulfatase A-like enzyme